eukprot:GHVS01002408.1.p1 GENE.GHVS01002408.1~~GHVS01002408.1.p1  ORF type:complete len:124 (-),score=12.83 GHVS01002408.1:488-859(-)
MKTFRMIVLAVIAAIAIGGLVVDSKGLICRSDADCIENDNCMAGGSFLGITYNFDGYGLCRAAVTFLETKNGNDALKPLFDLVKAYIGISQTDMPEKYEDAKAGIESKREEVMIALNSVAGSD